MSGSRITPTRLAEADARKKYYRDLAEAEEYRRSIEPTLTEVVSQRGRYGAKPSPAERLKEAAVSAAETQITIDAIRGSNGSYRPPVTARDVLDKKASIASDLARSGIPPDQVRKYLDSIGPQLDAVSMIHDPWAASFLYDRWNNQGQLQLTDMVQAMKMMNEMSPRQQQFDVPAMFTAMGSIMQAMKQDRQDPTAMIGVLQGIYDKMNAQTKEASQAMLEFYKSQIPPSKTLAEQLWELKEVQSSLGLRSEDPVIASKKLELQASHDQREHEWRLEAAKEKRQSEMIKGITGAITRGLESPIIREAGRSVGQALSQHSPGTGAVVNAITRAPEAVARAEINKPPTQVTWGFKCQGCGAQKTFSQLELALIEQDHDGKYVCERCGDPYQLKPDRDKDTEDSQQ